MKILNKLQTLPERKKKIILWITLIIMGVFLFVFNIQNMKKRMEDMEKENIEDDSQTLKLKEEFNNLLNFDIPEEIKSLFEEINL